MNLQRIKVLMIALILCCFSLPGVILAQEDSLELLYPLGGEEILQGNTLTISWVPDSISTDSIDIYLWDGIGFVLIGTRIPATQGSFDWIATVFAGDRYRVKLVKDDTLVNLAVMSPAYFTVYESGPIIKTVVEEKPDVKSKIYPNPVGDYVNLTLDKEKFVSQIYIYDFSGYLMKSINCNSTVMDYRINVSDFSNGVYFMKIIYNDNQYSFSQFIINK